MSGPLPPPVILTAAERQALEALVQRHSTPQQLALRARIILAAAAGQNNGAIARAEGVDVETPRLWRRRWRELQEIARVDLDVAGRLADAPRPGAPVEFTAEQMCQLMALACIPPADCGRPITHWTARELAAEAAEQGIVKSISPRTVGRFFKRCGPKAALKSVLAEPVPYGTRGGKERQDCGGESGL